MEIIQKKAEFKCRLYELKVGDTFEWNNNIYMKIERVSDYCYRNINAVNLTLGCAVNLDPDKLVIPVNAQLIIT